MTLLVLIFSFVLSACAAIPTPAERVAAADALARNSGWKAEILNTEKFELLTYMPATWQQSATLTIYIEGDGLAWISSEQPSADPTPNHPLALHLALSQPEGAVVYLARPCQYMGAQSSRCTRRYWTEERFAPEVVASTNEAIDLLKQRFGASRLTLVGYSGGAAVATLAAARRSDVERLVTVAGNLDHRAWTSFHRLSPLKGSLNPVDNIDRLRDIQQWHLVGEEDKNTTPELVKQFAQRFSTDGRAVVQVVPSFDHQCCWVSHWSSLWRQIQSQTSELR